MSRFQAFLLACVVICCPTTSLAGLATDPSAFIDGSLFQWHGSTGYESVEEPSLNGYVEWAVFAPGAFPGGYAGYVPTPGEFVYTYQVFEVGPAPLSNLSVSLETIADNIGWFTGDNAGNGLVDGDVPTASYFFPDDITPTSANWDFSPGISPNILNPDGSTMGLAFSSPYGPINLDGSVVNGGGFALVIPLPSPVPEPGTLVFWSCGIVFCAVRYLRRRGRKAAFSASGASSSGDFRRP